MIRVFKGAKGSQVALTDWRDVIFLPPLEGCYLSASTTRLLVLFYRCRNLGAFTCLSPPTPHLAAKKYLRK